MAIQKNKQTKKSSNQHKSENHFEPVLAFHSLQTAILSAGFSIQKVVLPRLQVQVHCTANGASRLNPRNPNVAMTKSLQ